MGFKSYFMLLLAVGVFITLASFFANKLINKKITYFRNLSKDNYAYMGDGKGLVVTQEGLNLFVDTTSVDISIPLIRSGIWEEHVTKVVKSLLKPGMKVIEVGTHVGYYTTLMAKYIEKDGKIWAFEANKRLADFVQDSVNVNGFGDRVVIYPKPVLNEKKTITFRIFDRYSGGGSCVDLNPTGNATKVSEEDKQKYGDYKEVALNTVTLDDQVPEHKIDFIRMDAEGVELLILKGAKDILKQSPEVIIMMEWDTLMMNTNQLNISQEVADFTKEGYNFYLITQQGQVEKIEPAKLENIGHVDVIMTRKDLII